MPIAIKERRQGGRRSRCSCVFAESWLINARRLYRQTYIWSFMLTARNKLYEYNMLRSALYIQASRYVHILYTRSANLLLLLAVINSANLQFAISIVRI